MLNDAERLQFSELEAIGTILTGGRNSFYRVSDILRSEHFSIPELGEVYQTLVDMDGKGLPLTPGNLIGQLPADAVTTKMKELIAAAAQSVISPSGIRQNAQIIINSWKRRRAQEAVTEIMFGEPDLQAISDIADSLHEIVGAGDGEGISHWSEAVDEAKRRMFEPVSERRLFLGMSGCDAILGGIDPTDYAIIAARPAVGKSSFAGQIVRNFAKKGKKILFVSLEMPKQQIIERMTASLSDIRMDTIRNRVASMGVSADIEREQIEMAVEQMRDWKIDIHDTGRMRPSQLLRLVKMRKYDVVIVDHLGLMMPDGRTVSREQEVATVSRALRSIAMNCNIQIIALCQLNRAVEQRPTNRVRLSDLRDSGSLEQDATAVIGLSVIDDSKVLFEVLKNRNGALGTQVLRFDKKHMRFIEMAEEYQEPDRKALRGMEI